MNFLEGFDKIAAPHPHKYYRVSGGEAGLGTVKRQHEKLKHYQALGEKRLKGYKGHARTANRFHASARRALIQLTAKRIEHLKAQRNKRVAVAGLGAAALGAGLALHHKSKKKEGGE